MDSAEVLIADVASRKPIVLSHPGAVELGGDLYAGAERSTIDLVERQSYRGRNRFNANSLVIGGGSSTFVVSPGVILGQVYLNATVNVLAKTRVCAFWLLKMIKTVRLQIPGQSGFGDLSISGESHFQALMAMTGSEEKRRALAEACPRYYNLNKDHTIAASIPIILPWSSSEITGAYGLDTGAFSTPLNITIEWKSTYNVMSTPFGVTVALPSAFASLYMRATETDILDSRANLGRKLRMNPSLAYPVPFLSLQSAVEPIANVVPGTEFQTTLNALPSGQIQAILLTMIPDIWTGTASGSGSGTQFVHPFGVDFASLRVERDGQTIYQFDTRVEGDLSQTLSENGGNGKAFYVPAPQALVDESGYGGADDPTTVPVGWRHRVYVVPICHEISEVLTERRHEHTASYAGVNLQIFANIAPTQFQVTNQIDPSRKAQALDPFAEEADVVQLRNPGLTPAAGTTYPSGVGNEGTAIPAPLPQSYRLHVTYIRNAILETIGQSVKLIT